MPIDLAQIPCHHCSRLPAEHPWYRCPAGYTLSETYLADLSERELAEVIALQLLTPVVATPQGGAVRLAVLEEGRVLHVYNAVDVIAVIASVLEPVAHARYLEAAEVAEWDEWQEQKAAEREDT